ncbi:MAG: hypothetical protein KBD12_01735 [Candidatus Pacebacteria bacterium]|nr:hypothetical protein [Candidatus Paceibacterota bacterium]
MDNTMIILKIVAIYYTFSGLMMIFKKNTLALVFKDFFSHPSVPWITGVFMIALGGLLVLTHNIWSGDWKTVLVTFMSWLILIKGLVYMIWPDKMANTVKNFKSWSMPIGIIVFVIGIILFRV